MEELWKEDGICIRCECSEKIIMIAGNGEDYCCECGKNYRVYPIRIVEIDENGVEI